MPALVDMQERLSALEHITELELKRLWRKHPLAPWAKEYRGLGEKSIARLIAEIGDPAERPNPAKLWAYCGFGDPALIRIPKNATQEEIFKRGNPRAKKQAWLIATKLVMFDGKPDKNGRARPRSLGRDVYDATRAKYADLEISDGQKHARAIRATAKAFLLDLWLAARHSSSEAHTSYASGSTSSGHLRHETQSTNAGGSL